MKLRYWLTILMVVVIVVVCVVVCTPTKKDGGETLFLNAQKMGRRRQQPVKVGSGGGAKGPALFKAPTQTQPTSPGPKKGNYSLIPGLCSDEACVKRVNDLSGKNRSCEKEDEYCVFAKGATGQGCINNGMKQSCLTGLPKGGVECKYTDKDCLKAIRPVTASPPPVLTDVLEACTNTTLEQCTSPADGSCIHYTCNTKEDAQRINANNAQLVCKRDQVVKCDTEGNTAFCGCFPYYLDEHGKKDCPDGWVKKGIRIPCKGGPKNYIKSIRVPACKPMMQSYYICELPPPVPTPGGVQTLPPPTPGGVQTFQGCVNTHEPTRDPSTFLSYTCDTPEDVDQINEKSINMTCKRDKILKCTTRKGTIRDCECAEILPGDYDGKPCPEGLVVKSTRVFPPECVNPPCPGFRNMLGRPYKICALP